MKECPELCAGVFIRHYAQERFNNPESATVDSNSDPLTFLTNSYDATETLVAHILATKTTDFGLTHKNDIETITIHSIQVEEEYRGKSIGATLLKDYIQRMGTVGVGSKIVIKIDRKVAGFFEREKFIEMDGYEASDKKVGYERALDHDDDDDM